MCCVLGPVPGSDYGPYPQRTPGLGLSLSLETSHLARVRRALEITNRSHHYTAEETEAQRGTATC